MTSSGWALLLVAGVWALDQIAKPASRIARLSHHQSSARPVHRSATELVGSWVRQRVGRSQDATRDLVIGRSLIALVVLAPVSVRVAVGTSALVLMRSVWERRRTERLRLVAIERALAQAIDLFLVALRSGHNVNTAVDHVGQWVRGDLGQGFRWCTKQVANGRAMSDALELLPDRLGPTIQPLVAALVANDRYGAPVIASLGQLAAESRATQRRRAEANARRLPVTLLFPLVVCVLPAFLILTVVPVVAESLSNFDFGVSP